MSALAATPAYTALLAKFPPRVIRSDEQNQSYLAALQNLERHQEQWTEEESELADLLTLLIENYEEKAFQLPAATPVDAIHFLMDQHSLCENDLAEVFGAPGILAEVLSGKRDLNKEQIRHLSRRFHVSPELFF